MGKATQDENNIQFHQMASCNNGLIPALLEAQTIKTY